MVNFVQNTLGFCIGYARFLYRIHSGFRQSVLYRIRLDFVQDTLGFCMVNFVQNTLGFGIGYARFLYTVSFVQHTLGFGVGYTRFLNRIRSGFRQLILYRIHWDFVQDKLRFQIVSFVQDTLGFCIRYARFLYTVSFVQDTVGFWYRIRSVFVWSILYRIRLDLVQDTLGFCIGYARFLYRVSFVQDTLRFWIGYARNFYSHVCIGQAMNLYIIRREFGIWIQSDLYRIASNLLQNRPVRYVLHMVGICRIHSVLYNIQSEFTRYSQVCIGYSQSSI